MSEGLTFTLITCPTRKLLGLNASEEWCVQHAPCHHSPWCKHTHILLGTWGCRQSAEGATDSLNFNKWAKLYWVCQLFNVITTASQHHCHLYLVWNSASWFSSSSTSLPDTEKPRKWFMSSEKVCIRAAWSRGSLSFLWATWSKSN